MHCVFLAIAYFFTSVFAAAAAERENATGESVTVAEAIVLYEGTADESAVERGQTGTVLVCFREGATCAVEMGNAVTLLPGSTLKLGDGRTALELETEFWAETRAITKLNAELRDPFPDIILWGDSLTNGSGAKPGQGYGDQIAMNTLSTVIVRGVGGEGAAAIAGRFSASPELHHGVNVIWAGRNDVPNANSPTEVPQRIQGMVGQLGPRPYLVLSVTNGLKEPRGSDDYNRILKINEALQATFGDHYLDVRTLINRAGEQGVDASMDIPSATLMADDIHFNENGYKIVADAVLAKIRAMKAPSTFAAVDGPAKP